MADWSRLHHAHGTAEDVPALLASVGPEAQHRWWDDLWSRLWCQGTVSSASYATLPALAPAGASVVGDRSTDAPPLTLAGAIGDQPYGYEDLLVTHAAAIVVLIEEALRDP
ncbi:hypothetical protein [Streptomyces sp. NPDC088733]|uniref:hypothetical protein n=1 Tax=Streptomyces sp. NPDC088733 TaxID=3365880 RepID=UPI00382C877B